MRVAIIGAGIVGVSTAYELARQGHEVTVYDKRASVAEEASFAPGGVLSAGWPLPGPGAGLGSRLIGQFLTRHAGHRWGGWPSLQHLPWMWRWLRAGRRQAYTHHMAALLRLAQFSQRRLQTLGLELDLALEQHQGLLVLLRSPRDQERLRAHLAALQEAGIPHRMLDANDARATEPALSRNAPLHAAVHLPQDGAGNCRQFAQLLKAQAQQLGAQFRFEAAVTTLSAGPKPVVHLARGLNESHDAVVVCAGTQAQPVLSSVGVRLPLVPVYGYSVTANMRVMDGLPSLGPRSAVIDAHHEVSISRLGQRLRVSGVRQLGGRAGQLAAPHLALLYRVLDDWFPGSLTAQGTQQWKGARPTLPDGPPVLGPSGAPGVWLNLGHGASGWTLACGSAMVLADVISGRAPPLDLSGLTVDRLR